MGSENLVPYLRDIKRACAANRIEDCSTCEFFDPGPKKKCIFKSNDPMDWDLEQIERNMAWKPLI